MSKQKSLSCPEALERGAKPKNSKGAAWEIRPFFTPFSRDEADAAAEFEWQQWMENQENQKD